MHKPLYHAAVIWIIKDETWNVLFQMRQNTGKSDNFYHLPWWHIDNHLESPEHALKRELKEELWIEIIEFELKHISKTIKPTFDNTYILYFFEVLSYSWKIVNNEPLKCKNIAYLDYKKSPSCFEYFTHILKEVENWIFYSEYNLDEV